MVARVGLGWGLGDWVLRSRGGGRGGKVRGRWFGHWLRVCELCVWWAVLWLLFDPGKWDVENVGRVDAACALPREVEYVQSSCDLKWMFFGVALWTRAGFGRWKEPYSKVAQVLAPG